VRRNEADTCHAAGVIKNSFFAAKLNELSKIRVGAVSYLNTKPLLYGVKQSASLMSEIDLVEDYPAKIGEMLLNDEIDVGLVPVAIIPKLKEHYIVTDYCIGAEDEVASVSLYSDVSIEKVEKVLLDYQSRTSVNLARILLRDFWKVQPVLENTHDDFRKNITGNTAGVVIGDRAFEQRNISAYNYDLALAWKQWTNLPFVFAAWVANKNLPLEFQTNFNQANAYGLQKLDEVVAENPYDKYDLKTYYTKNISYDLTDKKKEGLNKFLSLL
jgi:chorismate dehydratase